MISILHFSTTDNEGGSARSAYRIHSGLRKLGITSRMLVGKKVTNDPDVEGVAGTSFGRYLDLFVDRYNRFRGHQYLSVPSSRRLIRNPWLAEANIIQLYNTHGGYFSHLLLPELSKRAPLVWRLSDMWPMTPHAAYSYGCECYKKGPDNCVCELSSYPAIGRDTKKMLWKMKERMYSELKNLTIVAPSTWMKKIAKESILLSQFPIHYIPNGIDLTVFYPRDRLEVRQKLGISKSARVILFTAHGLDRNPRKGSEVLMDILNRFGPQKNTLLLLAGRGGESFCNRVPLPVKLLGSISSKNDMAEIYASADILVAPSVAENLPNNALEALACGTPVVAFDAGGMSDAVIHKQTGYLVKYDDREDFVRGIKMLFEDVNLCSRLSGNALLLSKEKFDQQKEIASFSKLYESIIAQTR